MRVLLIVCLLLIGLATVPQGVSSSNTENQIIEIATFRGHSREVLYVVCVRSLKTHLDQRARDEIIVFGAPPRAK